MKEKSKQKSTWKNYVLKFVLISSAILLIYAFVPSILDDFFMPGSQPGQSGNLDTPQKCDNCHGGYDSAVEPAYNWRGSMMSQAMRDPLFLAAMSIANQDAPDSGDLCIRCHSPSGWLEGRSVPTDGSALNNNDMEGVQCDFCHKLVKPSPIGVNPYPDDTFYTQNTYADDQQYLATLSHIPPQDGNGMYVASNSNAKRGPFADANAKHKMRYSPFHQESAICGTCHDVSNPVYERQPGDIYTPNDFGEMSTTFNTYELFPVERTYSEWLNSAYNTSEGVYAPQFGGNKEFVSTCQDCHMKDVSGFGCNKNGVPFRDDLPLHDMTGGNTFVPGLVAQLFPGDVDIDALNAGVERAIYMLQNAATMDVSVNSENVVTVKVTNETGHKLPSGYPEGRRIWINIKAYDPNGEIAYESGAYDFNTAILTHDDDVKIYEVKPGLSTEIASLVGVDPGPSFHFVLNNEIFYDNRIPPRGFTNAAFEQIQSPPINYTYADGQYWDETEYVLPSGENIDQIEVTLYYQTLSKDYVDFLRDENTTDDKGDVMHNLWTNNGKSAPEVMENTIISLSPPTAEFTATPDSGYAPLEVQFLDQSTNGPASWSWDFGDGNTSTDQNPIHTFTNIGTHTITLTAANSFGGDSTSHAVTVSELTQPVIYVDNMNVSRISLNGNRQAGVCEVSIMDTDNNPVTGVSVSASYDGPTAGNVESITDTNGIATLQTRAKKGASGIWCFAVLDVVKTDMIYNPALNFVNPPEACEPVRQLGVDDGLTFDNFKIQQVFPNPFWVFTTLDFELGKDSKVEMFVFTESGKMLETLTNKTYFAGQHSIDWNAENHAAGIYFIKIIIDGNVQIFKVIKAN